MKNLMSVSLLAISVFLLSISMSVAVIYIPLGLDKMLEQESLIGLILSFEPVVIVAFSLLLPRLLRHQGVAVWVVALIPLKFLACWLLSHQNPYAWALAVAVLAIAGSGQVILTQYWCNHVSTSTYKGAVLGLFGTALSAGLMLGPYLVTRVTELAPYLSLLSMDEIDAENNLILLFSLLASAPLFLILASAPRAITSSSTSLWQCFNLSKGPMLAIAMAGSSFFSCAGFLVLYGVDNQSETYAPILFSAFILGALLLELPLAILSDWIERRYVIVGCVVISMTCVSYLPIAITDLSHALVLLFVWGGFLGGIYSISLALISERLPQDVLLQSSCTFSLMENIGGVVGLIITGVLTSIIGSDALVYVLMATNLCYFAFAFTRYRIV